MYREVATKGIRNTRVQNRENATVMTMAMKLTAQMRMMYLAFI